MEKERQKDGLVNLVVIIQLAMMGYFLVLLDANAYTFTDDLNRGIYWKSFPIGMKKFATDSSDGPLLEQVVQQAEAAWESATDTDLWSFEDGVINSSNYSGNYIRWSYDFANETGYDASSTLAITIRHSSGTHFERTEIILNASDETMRRNAGGKLLTVVMHELGHVIGLNHTDEDAVMSAYVTTHTTLQDDDIAGANAVINEHKDRQASGFVAAFAREEDKNALEQLGTCGTVDLDQNGPGGGPLGFLASLMLGFLLILSIRRLRPVEV